MSKVYLMKYLLFSIPSLLYFLPCIKKTVLMIYEPGYIHKDSGITLGIGIDLGRIAVKSKTLDKRNETEEEFMKRIKMRMDFRKKVLRRKCKELGVGNTTNPIRFIIAHKQKLLYCCTPKSGTTNWKKIFLSLNGDAKDWKKMRRPAIHERAKRFSVDSYVLPPGTENYLKLMVVRDPLNRLYSAYHDKLARRKDGRIRWPETSKKINRFFSKRMKSAPASFEGFAKYLVTTDDDNARCKVKAGLEKERHWMTFHELCNPCLIDYDVIGKLETVEEDSRYVLQLLGLHEKMQYEKGYGENGSSQTLQRNVLKCYKSLDSHLQKALFNYIAVDYDLLSYTYPINPMQLN